LGTTWYKSRKKSNIVATPSQKGKDKKTHLSSVSSVTQEVEEEEFVLIIELSDEKQLKLKFTDEEKANEIKSLIENRKTEKSSKGSGGSRGKSESEKKTKNSKKKEDEESNEEDNEKHSEEEKKKKSKSKN